MDLRCKIKNGALQIVRRLVESGYESYIVGGAVRDLLLGCVPKDYDIATKATPEQVREVFGRRQCVIIGRRFRLAQVRMGDDVYEVSTFRRTPSESERRSRADDDGQMIWNDNVYGTLDEDMMRRDFTVNAMYYDPVGGEVIDRVGGHEDLRNRTVRVIGDARIRFTEDPVRMLRALKLVGMHGFRMTEETESALHEKCGMIQLSSISRLYEELLKIFMTGHSHAILTAFQAHGFLGCFWPKLDEIWNQRVGKMCRRLLLARDQEFRRGCYSNSKAFALATACLPYVMHELEEYSDGFEEDDWSHREGVAGVCLETIRRFYDGFVLPRFYSLRVKEIVLMIPALCNEELGYRYYRNREYKYGRLLVGLLVKGLGWDEELFERLPEPEKALALPRRRGRRRKPRPALP